MNPPTPAAAPYTATQSSTVIDPGTSLSQLQASYVIQHHGRIRIGRLGRMLGLSPNGTTMVLDGLEEAGRIVLERDPADRRAVLVALTSEGTRWLADAHSESLRGMEPLLARLSVEELRALDLGLSGLERAIRERAEADDAQGECGSSGRHAPA